MHSQSLLSKIKYPFLFAALFIVSAFFHNLIFALFEFEEPVFLILAVLSLVAIPTSIIYQLTHHYLITFISFLILALDWTALDDITTGNEPDYNGEYLVVAISAVFFIGVVGWLLRRRKHHQK